MDNLCKTCVWLEDCNEDESDECFKYDRMFYEELEINEINKEQSLILECKYE